jgi:hypothetical protein
MAGVLLGFRRPYGKKGGVLVGPEASHLAAHLAAKEKVGHNLDSWASVLDSLFDFASAQGGGRTGCLRRKPLSRRSDSGRVTTSGGSRTCATGRCQRARSDRRGLPIPPQTGAAQTWRRGARGRLST